MNKKLLTAAIGAALAMGATAASADVKLYGKIHVSVDYVDGKASSGAAANKNWGVASNASRWGIDVSEKLGGGLTAIGKLETEIDATNEGANDMASRNRYVGLTGGWGTVLGGTLDTPFKELSRKVELFPEYVGDTRALVSQSGSANHSSLGWDLRPRSVLAYVSPSLSGFTLAHAQVADAQSSSTSEDNRNKASSTALSYASGPLYVAYAYETHRLATAFGGTGTGDSSETGNRLAASYNFGAFKLVGLYQDLKDLGGKRDGESSIKRKSWAIGGAYTAGNNVFKVQYVKADALSNTTTGASADNTGAKMWAIGWDHLFSKTTKAYIAYAKTDNDSSAAFSYSAGHNDLVTPGTGNDPQAWSVGMILDF